MSLSRLVIVSALLVASPAAAQEPSPSAVEFAAGTLVFADNGAPAETFVGASARFYTGKQLSVGPEIVYVRGDGHSHLLVTGNLTFDMRRPGAAGPATVTPFVTAGGGLFQTRERFPTEVFTSSEGTFTAGGGLRVRAGRRVHVGAEARVGWELHVRLNGVVGVRLGR